nr:MAG TPA: hypothetical protein [Caudoviricetes sp.]
MEHLERELIDDCMRYQLHYSCKDKRYARN